MTPGTIPSRRVPMDHITPRVFGNSRFVAPACSCVPAKSEATTTTYKPLLPQHYNNYNSFSNIDIDNIKEFLTQHRKIIPSILYPPPDPEPDDIGTSLTKTILPCVENSRRARRLVFCKVINIKTNELTTDGVIAQSHF